MSDINDVLKKVTASIEDATGKFNAQAEKALKEAKNAGELSGETKAAVDKMATELNALREAEKTLKAQVGEIEQHVAQMPLRNAVETVNSIGEQVISAETIRALNSNIDSLKNVSVPIKAALTSPDLPGQIIAPDRQQGIIAPPKQRLFIRNLIAGGRTQSNTIYYIKQKSLTNNAKIVPENTEKPYSDINFEEASVPVRTIAHMFKASKQILAVTQIY